MAEWSKALAWKVSIRQKRIEGSNPSRSATDLSLLGRTNNRGTVDCRMSTAREMRALTGLSCQAGESGYCAAMSYPAIPTVNKCSPLSSLASSIRRPVNLLAMSIAVSACWLGFTVVNDPPPASTNGRTS